MVYANAVAASAAIMTALVGIKQPQFGIVLIMTVAFYYGYQALSYTYMLYFTEQLKPSMLMYFSPAVTALILFILLRTLFYGMYIFS